MKDVKAAVKGVQPAGTLPGRTANSIHWSPQGKNLVLAGLKVWFKGTNGHMCTYERVYFGIVDLTPVCGNAVLKIHLGN